MKKIYLKHLLCEIRFPICLILLFLIITKSYAQSQQSYETGGIRIKFSEQQANNLDRMRQVKSSDGYVMTGISAIDKLNRQYKVSSMKRVFREAGKFEAKHRKYGLHLWYEVTLDKNADLKQTISSYSNTSEVAIAEPIYKKTLSIDKRELQSVSRRRVLANAPNDPQFVNQWHYNNTGQGGGVIGADISLLDAWKVETGNSNVIVAITDGGVQVNHPDLAANMWVNTHEIPGNNIDDDNNGYIDDINGFGFGDNTGAIAPDDHGSHVGGTIAAVTNNGIGVSGVAGGTGNGNGVRLMSCAAFGANDTQGFEDTYVYAADNGAVISQNSWGYTTAGVFEQVVLDGIDYFIAEAGYDKDGNPHGPMQGGLVIFAAGNSGTDAQWYPGIYNKVMAIGGSDRKDNPYGSSNRGAWVELTAPAVGVLSSIANNGYASFNGTSMACPHVSGTAALIISKYAGHITPQQVWDRLVSTADKVSTLPAGFGSGRLNASNALQENDHKAPERITDLKVLSKIQNAITLQWTAPIDSGNVSASVYDIRYSTSPIDSANFLLATKAKDIPVPLTAGQVQTFKVTGLQSGTRYYFAIKSADLFGNTSKLSNIASDLTTEGSEIEVSPDSLNVTIDVNVNPEVTKSLTIHNSGKGELEFSSKVLLLSSELSSSEALKVAALDMKLYGLNSNSKEKIGQANVKVSTLRESQSASGLNFIDSLYYDNKDEVADDFVGFSSGAAFAAASKFKVTKSSFVLTHVRNLYRTQPLTSAPVILEVYKGGDSPSAGTLLLTKTVTSLSTEGSFFTFALDEPQTFVQNDVFWIVFKYPNGISFPQGIDEGVTGIAGIYYYSPDGGSTWNPAEVDIPGAAFKTRAMCLSTTGAAWVTLDPASGIVPSDSSQTIGVKFSAADQYNGTYKFKVLISSNDISDPVVTIPVTAVIKGQQPKASVSNSFIEFGSVLVGAKKDLTFELFNKGKGSLSINSIISTIPEFIVVNNNLKSIKPGEKALVTVRFAPTAIGNKSGKIKVSTNDPVQPLLNIVVVGVGTESPILTIIPDTVYTTVNAGEITEDSLTIKNTGAYPLVFSFPEFAAQRLLNNKDIEKNNTSPIEFAAISGKNVRDTRKGHPVKLGAGKDKKFGYTWIDSNEPGGPVFNWQDISATGTSIKPGADGSVTLNLPFKFKFFGNLHDKVIIASNGFLTFSSALGSFGGYLNTQIPAASDPSNLIAPFWDDLEPQEPGASVAYKVEATRLVVQYTDVPAYDEVGTVTFQVIIYKEGNIEYLYKDVESASFIASATVGLENRDGSDGAQVVFNSAYIKDSLAVRFNYPTPKFITDVSLLSGILLPGEETTVLATLDATELNDGKYLDQLIISSNDPAHASKGAPFILAVIGQPQIEIAPDALSYDTTFIGESKASTLLIKNTGTKQLEVTFAFVDNPVFSTQWANNPVFIDPKDDLKIPVTYTPKTVGLDTGNVWILFTNAAGDPDHLLVPLSGVGVSYPQIRVTPSSITRSVRPGKKVVETLTIQNPGGYRLDYSLTGTYWINPQIARTAAIKYPELTSKDQLDTRKGVPVQYGYGGPDSLGYVWSDNKIDKGLKFSWTDISTSGTKLTLGGDNSQKVKLPFKFWFYGNSKDSVYVASNGFLTFNSALGTIGGYSNSAIPSSVAPNNLIAPFWDDIEPQSGDGVYYLSTPSSFIVQYTNVPHYGTTLPGKVTFQVILYPDGSIKYQYKNVSAASFKNSATVGIENPRGTDGLPIVFNANYLQDSLAIFIKAPLRGSIAPGQQVKVAVTLDAKDLKDGIYKDNIIVKSTAQLNPRVYIPVTLKVGAPHLVVVDSLAFGSLFVSPDSVFSQSKSLLIKNTGTDVLNIASIHSENAAFTVSAAGPVSLNPGQSVTLSVSFSPTQIKDYKSFLVIISDDDNDTIRVAVSGKGIAPPLPVYYTLFAKVKSGGKEWRPINIDNTKGGSSLFYSTSVQYGQNSYAQQRSYPSIERLMDGVINIPESAFNTYTKGNLITAVVNEKERTATANWLTVAPPSGEVKAGKIKTLTVTLDAAGLQSGHYYGKLLLRTNDPFKPAVEIPAHLHVNAKPAFVPQAEDTFSISRPSSFVLNIKAKDADKDSIVYSLLGNTPHAALATRGDSAVFSFTPARTQIGYYKFHVLASDDLESDTLIFYVNVIDSNHAPKVIAPIRDKTYSIGAPAEVIALASVFSDADGDVLSYSVSGNNANVVEVTIIKGRLFVIPLDSGHAQVLVSATDESGLSATDTFKVTVADPADTSVAKGSKDNGEITSYPNPAIDYTNLKYELSKADFVNIEVLNNHGEQIAVLVNEHQSEGKYKVKFDTKGLSLGLYFYRVRIGDHVKTKRIIIQ